MDAPLQFEQDPELDKQRIRSLEAFHALDKAKQAVAKSGTGLTTNELRGFKVDGMNLPSQS